MTAAAYPVREPRSYLPFLLASTYRTYPEGDSAPNVLLPYSLEIPSSLAAMLWCLMSPAAINRFSGRHKAFGAVPQQ